jgi:nanoRNase/pAp phosphatase (c-di-AMP/oligoRNAs hydrolase)
MALLITKFGKKVNIYIRDQIPEQLSYLMNICTYNRITVIQGPVYSEEKPDAVFILDTPKPDMIALNADITQILSDNRTTIVEFDHHLSADASLSGNEGYCFVTRASSTCELIGLFCCKVSNRKDTLAALKIEEIFSRNLALSLLTGMIGDTKFGLTLKTGREIFFYKLFTTKFSAILRESARKKSKNYTRMTDIFKTIQSLTVEEKDLYQMILEHARYSGRTGILALDAEMSKNYVSRVDYRIFVNVIKSLTDYLSEKSGTFGLTAYYDMDDVSDLVQFRVRLSRTINGIDLRRILLDLAITDGGGHPGAIGFRIKKSEMSDLGAYVTDLVKKIEALQD